MKPIIHLFTPIFFATVGLSLDLSALDWGSMFFWLFSLSLAAVAILSKIIGALFVREKFVRRVIIGMAMVPRGEVGLVFAELGRHTGLFTPEIYTTVVIVITYTTLFTPFWLRLRSSTRKLTSVVPAINQSFSNILKWTRKRNSNCLYFLF